MRYEAAFYVIAILALIGAVTGWAVRRDLKRAEQRRARRALWKLGHVRIRVDVAPFQSAMREAVKAMQEFGTALGRPRGD